jgi:hypothetical protein
MTPTVAKVAVLAVSTLLSRLSWRGKRLAGRGAGASRPGSPLIFFSHGFAGTYLIVR